MKSSVRRLLLAMFTAAMVLGLNVLPAAVLQESHELDVPDHLGIGRSAGGVPVRRADEGPR